jgi:hypothetical protein
MEKLKPCMTKREEMQMLDKLETLLKKTEDTPERVPTNRAFLMVVRVVYYLLMKEVKR